MGNHRVHESHDHRHGAGCGHTAIEHGDHVDYLHDGHLHREHEGHVDECMLTGGGPDCTKGHDCSAHPESHRHGQGCGHEPIPHAGHVDFLVDGHLHHPHEGHCDDHGRVKVRG